MGRAVEKAACLILLLTCASPFAQNAPNAQQRPALQNGEIVTIHSVTKPAQSYELYVPSNYTPDRRWPIIYAFDPSAQGSRPLQFMKEAAETYGYLVAGSNNSRNGSWEVDAMQRRECGTIHITGSRSTIAAVTLQDCQGVHVCRPNWLRRAIAPAAFS
jgi:hypothetical protein